MTRPGILDRPAVLTDLEDRPLGPVFESTFDVGAQVVHVLVVRGAPELLEEARGRVTELLELWLESDDELDRLVPTATTADLEATRDPVAPESLVLGHVTRTTHRGSSAADRRALLRAVAPAFAADLVARDLVEGGALGCCVRIGDHASMAGVPPRLAGWRVEVPDAGDRDGRELLVVEGGVSSAVLGPGEGRTAVTAPAAWQAALQLEHTRQARTIRSGAE